MLWLRKSKKGFTLIELMVVVAIIAVLSLLGLRVYTGQATKARNSSVQANVHSLATELGVQILEKASPIYLFATATAAATKAQIVNPFDTSVKGGSVVVNAAPSAADAPGYIYCSDADTDTISGNDAYRLIGYDNNGVELIRTDVNYQ